jgi:hypothetical protein
MYQVIQPTPPVDDDDDDDDETSNEQQQQSTTATQQQQHDDNRNHPQEALEIEADSSSPSFQQQQQELTPFQATIHLLKGNLGPGVLNLPHAFSKINTSVSLLLFVVVALQGVYSMVLLCSCKEQLCKRSDVRTFMDVAHRALGRAGSRATSVLLLVLQGGVCCVFLNLVSTNLQVLLSLSDVLSIILTTILLLVLTLLRFLKNLTILSVIANIIMVTAIVASIVAGVSNKSSSSNAVTGGDRQLLLLSYNNNNNNNNNNNITNFVSDLFFAFEGIGLVLPIENSYNTTGQQQDNHHERQRQRRPHFRTILMVSMTTVAMLFVLVGVSWQHSTTTTTTTNTTISGSITAHLEQEYPHNLWYSILNTLVAVAVLFTFPLQLQPCMQVVDRWLDHHDHHHHGNIKQRRGIFMISGCCCCRRTATTIPTALSTTEEQEVNHLDRNSSSQDDDDDDDDDDECPSEPPDEQDGILLGDDSCSPSSSSSLLDTPTCCCGIKRWIWRRWCVVMICALIVLYVDSLSTLIALFGSIGQTGLAAMPSLIHLALMKQGVVVQTSIVRIVVDVLVVLFCGVVMVSGVVTYFVE